MRGVVLLLLICGVLLSMDAINRVFAGGSLLWLWLPVLTVAALAEYIKDKRT